MNFLQLVQQLQFESGTGNAPVSTVIGQRGEARRLVDWVTFANDRIQSMYVDWKFLRTELPPTFQTGIDVQDYAAPDDHHYWNLKSFEVEDVDIDQLPLPIPAEHFRPEDDRFRSASGGSARPQNVVILDNNQLRFWPVPDKAYTIHAEYFKKPVPLDPKPEDANTQIPVFPEQFHILIVWEALRLYANYENAEDSKAQALEGIQLWMPKLEAHQLRGSQEGTIADANEIVIRAV